MLASDVYAVDTPARIYAAAAPALPPFCGLQAADACAAAVAAAAAACVASDSARAIWSSDAVFFGP
jgi:hypothetical protein